MANGNKSIGNIIKLPADAAYKGFITLATAKENL